MWLCRFANLSTWTAPPGSPGRRPARVPGYRATIAYGRAVLERYDDEASRVVSAAREEASRLGHGHVGTEHLLLGLLRQRGSHAAEALDASGVFLEPCRQKVSEALASRVTPQATGVGSQLPFTDRASRALDRASRLSLRLGGDVVRSDQILLSVLDVEGTAGQVLRGLSVDPAVVRDALMAEAALPPAPSRDQTPAEALPPAGDHNRPSRRDSPSRPAKDAVERSETPSSKSSCQLVQSNRLRSRK